MTRFTATDHNYPRNNPHTIRLRSGQYIDLLAPEVEAIYLEDIAHALSQICRFGGHTATFYSVAEHSLLVASLLWRQFGDPELAAVGLLHDATEAYLGDMVRPLKHSPAGEGFRSVEANLEAVIARRFFPHRTDPFGIDDVKAADEAALVYEMAAVRDAAWRHPTPPAGTAYAFLAAAARWGIQ